MFGASSELASVMEFGFNKFQATEKARRRRTSIAAVARYEVNSWWELADRRCCRQVMSESRGGATVDHEGLLTAPGREHVPPAGKLNVVGREVKIILKIIRIITNNNTLSRVKQ